MPPVPLLNYRKISPELNELFVNPQRPRTFYEMSKDCELAVLRTCQSTLKGAGDPIPPKVRKNPPTVGAGFGFAENNKKVEKAAIDSVTRRLKRDGWKVTSVESLAVGYDLLAKQGGKTRNIEVNKPIAHTKILNGSPKPKNFLRFDWARVNHRD
jgi:hypothetical protein